MMILTLAPFKYRTPTDVPAALEFPFADAPLPGEIRPVAPGVFWLRMPLPFALDHINLWVLDDGDGWTLIDTGIDNDVTRGLWEQVLVGPLAAKPVKRLICTHFHPDHMGLAGWLARKLDIPAFATPEEWARGATMHAIPFQNFNTALIVMATQAGCDATVLDGLRARRSAYSRLTAGPPAAPLALDPAVPVTIGGRPWRIVVGEGHSPRLAALYAADISVLISSDQILPKITPNVSVHPDDMDSDPLARFLDSLERFRAVPDDVLVLPSHRLPFRGLHVRIDQMIAHHHDRLDRAREACRDGATGAQALAALFQRQLDSHQIMFALGETLAHLNFLIGRGEVSRAVGPDGVTRYRLV